MGYIQVEGVNIGAAIFDSNQLSVMRGGSLLLKLAVEDIAEKQCFPQLTPITTGASSGVYRVADNEALDDLVKQIGAHLSEHANYRHLTFAVAATQEQDFSKAKEILRAKIRLLQLRQPSAAPDPQPTTENQTAPQPCALEGIRRADKVYETPPKDYQDRMLSEACMARFLYGRDKLSLYETILGSSGKCKLSESFHDIVEGVNYGNLSNKLAIVYFDGNGFGTIQKTLVKTESDQTKFDLHIKDLRKDLLAGLLVRWREHPENSQKIRLETLLWGGDEMMFVVPAWRGFELLRLVYQISADWAYAGQKLSHAGGLVFCHYKTPIARMRKLAKELAEDVKEWMNGEGRKGNAFNYIALESIDYPAEALESFFERRYQNLSKAWAPVRPTENPKDVAKQLRNALKTLPRSQIFQLARLATQLQISGERGNASLQINGQLSESLTEFIAQTERLQKLYAGSDTFAKLPELLRHAACLPAVELGEDFTMRNELVLPDHKNVDTSKLKPEHIYKVGVTAAAWRWLHLAELWDYLAPQPQDEQGESA